jgi:hypothetical protein
MSCELMDASYGELIASAGPYFEKSDKDTLQNFDCILSMLLTQLSEKISSA